MAFLCLLQGAFSHEGDDRGRFRRLPAFAPFSPVSFPDLVVVFDLARLGRVLQHPQGMPDDTTLLVARARLAERMAERELDGQRARHAATLRPVRDHGHEDGADACRFDGTCQHGHVSGAVRSGRGDEGGVDLLLDHALGDLRTVALAPLVVVGLVAHEGVVLWG